MDILILFETILLHAKAVLLSLMLVLLVFEALKEKYYQWQSQRHRQQQRPVKSSASHQSGRTSQSYRTDPKNRALQQNLLILLRNDVPAAKRLLLQQRQSSPGKSDNWYLEKVIYDLERDRR